MIKTNQLTNYPKIYENCYWGNFYYECNKDDITDDIINNRNKFVEEYKVKHKYRPPQYVTKWGCRNKYSFLDHVEFYENNNNYIIITSIYGNLNVVSLDTLEKLEYKKIYKLYNTSAITFIKLILKKKKY